MNLAESLRKVAFVGMKPEAEDIIDYISRRASLLISVSTSAVPAVFVGRAEGLWAGVLVGLVTYIVAMRLCALLFFRSQGPR